MPVVDVAHGHLLGGRALHQQDKARGKAAFEVLDWSGLLAGTRAAAGLSGFEIEVCKCFLISRCLTRSTHLIHPGINKHLNGMI